MAEVPADSRYFADEMSVELHKKGADVLMKKSHAKMFYSSGQKAQSKGTSDGAMSGHVTGMYCSRADGKHYESLETGGKVDSEGAPPPAYLKATKSGTEKEGVASTPAMRKGLFVKRNDATNEIETVEEGTPGAVPRLGERGRGGPVFENVHEHIR